MLRLTVTLLLCAAIASLGALALPSTVFAQGAGDDQYADPFGDVPADDQADSGAGDPAPAADDGGGSAPADTGAAETAPDTSQAPVAAEDTSAEVDAAAPAAALPRTGLPAGLLALSGLALLACGTLIHVSLLRFAPNSVYARALRMGPLHQAPRPPGFEPLGSSRRIRRARR